MIIPVRCITCGKPVGGKWNEYEERVGKGETPAKVLDSLGLERYCCRTMFLTHKDISKDIGRFRV
ncbi:MAG: DNA-directed RNA polymerase subunit N [Candidatus Aenigmarchaeota archaeon]|nr:DNA-directed RNA polymerase subunit N [Candidatus Aenigmarchaeota archaeon]